MKLILPIAFLCSLLASVANATVIANVVCRGSAERNACGAEIRSSPRSSGILQFANAPGGNNNLATVRSTSLPNCEQLRGYISNQTLAEVIIDSKVALYFKKNS